MRFTTHNSAARAELCAIIGRSVAGAPPLGRLFEQAVDKLLVSGMIAQAEIVYAKFNGIADPRCIVEESSTREALLAAEYRDYSSGVSRPARSGRELLCCSPVWRPLLVVPRPYRAPRGPALRPTRAGEACAPTRQQAAARAEFARRAAEFGRRRRTTLEGHRASWHAKESAAARAAGLSIRAYRARKQPA